MFLDVILYGDRIVEDVREILESWREEHEEYYGRPHGQTLLSRQHGGFGFTTLPPEGGLWSTRYGSGLNFHFIQIVEDEDGVECVRLTFSGRPHGMRAEFARFLMTYWDASVEVAPNTRKERRLHAYVGPRPTPWETMDSYRGAVETPAI